MKKVFTILALIFLMPFSVNAEVKEFDENVYVIETVEEQDVREFCYDKLKDVESVGINALGNYFVLFDNDNMKKYLYNFSNNSCEKIDDDEYLKMLDEESYSGVIYKIINDILYEVTFTKEGIVEKYISASTHGALSGEDMYILKDGKFELVEEIDINDFDLYYVKAKFGRAILPFDYSKDYYVKKDENTLSYVSEPNEEDLAKGLYYEKKSRNEVFKVIKKLPDTEFILKKEITGLISDEEFDIKDNWGVFKIKDKFYVSFNHNSIGGVVFDLEGNLLKIEDNYIFNEFVAVSKTSPNGLFSTFVKKPGSKNLFYILDEDLNIVYKKEIEGNFVAYHPVYLTTHENIDYLMLRNSYSFASDYFIQKVKKNYLVKGDKKYNGSNMTFTLSSNLNGLKGVFINDEELSEEQFTAIDNNLTLKNEYLSKLDNNTYQLKVLYNDGGYVKMDLFIDVTDSSISEINNNNNLNSNTGKDIINPNTGDNIIDSFALGVLSLLGCIAILLYLKKNKVFIK